MIIGYIYAHTMTVVHRDNDGVGLELCGVGIVDMSSEEEDELNILSDVSLDESAYLLHNEAALLSTLSLGHPPSSGVAPEQGLQAGQKDVQTERKNIEAGEKSEQQLVVDVDGNEPSIPSRNEAFKLSSK